MRHIEADLLDSIATPQITPVELEQLHPLEGGAADIIEANRQELIDVMKGRDQRLIAVVGPCSMDNSRLNNQYAAVQFAEQLQELTQEPIIADNLLTIMRCPPPKPRTNLGMRGLDQLDPIAAHDIATEIVNRGIGLASEMMNAAQLSRYAGRLSMAWVGARNVEDTTIRHTLSAYRGLPVFCKNSGVGDIGAAVDAVKTIGAEHDNVEILLQSGEAGVIARSPGNPHTGIIWRGGSSYRTPETYEQGLVDSSETSLSYGVDVSHGGAVAHGGKKSSEGQQRCLDHLTAVMASGVLLRQPSMVMIEAYFEEGADTSRQTPGKSWTDPCVSLPQLKDMLVQLGEVHATLQ